MKKSKNLKRFAAAILAGTMMLAMGTTAWAEEMEVTPGLTENTTQVPLTKTISHGDSVKAPNTSFTFAVALGEEEKDSDGIIQAYAGVEGGLYFESGKNTLAFMPESTDVFEKETNLTIDTTKFSKPGVYHYIVTETQGTYDGITYDTSAYDVYVYIVNGTDGAFEVSATESKLNGTKSDIVFDNTYTTQKLTLKKMVAGNQANKSQKFKFDVTIQGADGEQYIAKQGTVTTTLTSGTTASFELGNEEILEIYGLSANDTYTIEEDDYHTDGYTTTIAGADKAEDLKATGDFMDNNESADAAVTYTNTKNAPTPTGIVTNVLPYVLMVVTAAGLAFVFLRKREYEK